MLKIRVQTNTHISRRFTVTTILQGQVLSTSQVFARRYAKDPNCKFRLHKVEIQVHAPTKLNILMKS